MNKKLLGLFLVFGLSIICSPVFARHMMGGELTYKYLYRVGTRSTYAINFKIYIDGSDPTFGNGELRADGRPAYLGVYKKSLSTGQYTLIPAMNMDLNNAVVRRVSPLDGTGCPSIACLNNVVIFLREYTDTITLDYDPNGYYLWYENAARNTTNNVMGGPTSNGFGNSYVAFIPNSLTYPNSSPQFTDLAIPFMLAGENKSFVNTATDPDGDRLVYRFVNPYDGTQVDVPANIYTTPADVPFKTSEFDLDHLFGNGGSQYLNTSNGFCQYYAPMTGAGAKYVVAIEIQEWRTLASGQQVNISATRREIQITVKLPTSSGLAGPDVCPDNITPVFNNGTVGVSPVLQYDTLTEHEPIRFNVGTTDAEGNQTNTLTASGQILDPSFIAPATWFATNGTGSSSGHFSWQPPCGLYGIYNLIVHVTDNGCLPKSSDLVYSFNINPFKDAPHIAGDSVVCSNIDTYTYKAAKKSSKTASRVWQVSGGTIIGSATADSVKVKWTGASADTIRLISTSFYGCTSTSKKSITRSDVSASVVNITGRGDSVILCRYDSVTLAASGTGVTGLYQWTTDDAAIPFNSTQTNIRVSPKKTTRYFLKATTTSSAGCNIYDTVTVNVIQPPTALSDTASVCSHSANISIGTVTEPGFTYFWTASTPLLTDSLSSSTVANPVLKYTNNTASDVVHSFYRLSRNVAGCITNDTIKVKIYALPQINLGPDAVVCPGGTYNLNAGLPSAGYTFSFNNMNGLQTISGGTAIFRLSNNTNAPIKNTYIITATKAGSGCSKKDTILIVVPALLDAAVKDTAACINVGLTLGPDTIRTGYIYNWTGTGAATALLSSTNGPHPTFTYSGTLPAPEFSYTLNVSTPAGGCQAVRTIKVKVSPPPVALAGRDTTFCSNVNTVIGSAPVTGLLYHWSPAEGISDTAVANPTIYISNTDLANTTRSYTLKVTDRQSGCTDVDDVVFTIKPQVKVYAGPDTGIRLCDGNTTPLGEASRLGYTYRWVSLQGLTNLSSTNTSTTNYTTSAVGLDPVEDSLVLFATNTATNCTYQDTVVVTSLPYPVINVTNATVCSKEQFLLNSNAIRQYTYRWSPALNLSDSDTSSPVFTAINTGTTAQTFTYTLTVSGPGCSESKNITVTVNPLPASNAGPDIQVCALSDFSIGAAARAGFAYSWAPGPGITASNSNSAKLTLNLPDTGTFPRTVRYILQTTNTSTRCFDTASVYVTMHGLFAVNKGTADSLCSGQSITIGQPADAAFTYLWSPFNASELSSATAAQPVLTLTNSGASVITRRFALKMTNVATGCSKTDTLAVRVNPLPDAATMAGPDKTVCTVEPVTVGSARISGYSYRWTPKDGEYVPGISGTISDDTLANPGVLLTLANRHGSSIVQPFKLLVTYKKTGCSDTATVNVTAYPRPVAQAYISDTLEVCSAVTDSLGTPALPGFTYTWSGNAGELSGYTVARPAVTISSLSQQVHKFKLKVVNNTTGCSEFDSVYVKMNILPVVSFAAVDSLCSGHSVAIGPVSAPANWHYRWSPSTGLSNDTLSRPVLTLSNPRSVADTAKYTLTVTSDKGCVSTYRFAGAVNPLPVARVGFDTKTVCSGATVLLGINPPISRYRYGVKPLSALPAQLSASVAQGFDAATFNLTLGNTGTAPIMHRFVYSDTTGSGCYSFDTVSITVKPVPVVTAAPAAAVNETLTVCSGVPVALGSAASVRTGYTYKWTGSGGILSDTLSPVPTFRAANTQSAPAFLTYTLTATDTTLGIRCTNLAVVTIKINALPAVDLGTVSKHCSGEAVTVGGASINGYTYLWSGGSVSSVISAQPTFNNTIAPGSASVVTKLVLHVQNVATGCANTDTLRITTNALPVANAGSLLQICGGGNITAGTPRDSRYTYRWTADGSTNISSDTAAQPLITAPNTGTADITDTLRLTVTDRNTGCVSRVKTSVIIHPLPLAAPIYAGSNTVCPFVRGVVYSVDSTAGIAYDWSISPAGAGVITSLNGSRSVKVDWNAEGQNVIVKVTPRITATGCQGPASNVTIQISPTLVPKTPSGATDFCNGPNRTATYTTGHTTGSTYQWFVKQPGGQFLPVATFTDTTVTVSWSGTGTGEVRVEEHSTQTNGNQTIQCFGTSAIAGFNILPAPNDTQQIAGPSEVCAKAPFTFSLPQPLPGSTFEWNIQNKLTGAMYLLTENSPVLRSALTEPGEYEVRVRETTSTAKCIGNTIIRSFRVNGLPITAASAYNTNICVTALGQVTSYSVVNPSSASVYTWTIDGADIKTFTGPKVDLKWDLVNAPSLKVLEVNASGCAGDTLRFSFIADRSRVDFITAGYRLGEPSLVDVNYKVINPLDPTAAVTVKMASLSGVYQIVGAGQAKDSVITVPSATAESAQFYKVETANSCGDILPSPTYKIVNLVAFSEDATSSSNLTWSAFEGWAKGVDRYVIWRKTDPTGDWERYDSTNGTTLTYTVKNGTDAFFQHYQIMAVQSETGIASLSNPVEIEFKNDLQSTNVVTANGDDLNRYLVIQNAELYTENELTVVNRWGKTVYHADTYINNWDPQDLPAGTYFYFFKATAPKSEERTGWFQLVK
ncbi:MAG: gliding motility-associated C-terminal domain-containing protein [Bacteroidota bacterium]